MSRIALFRIILCILVVQSWACSNDNNTGDQNTNSGQEDQSATPPSTGYDEMSESYYESDVRVIWQRPEIVMNIMGPLQGKTIADVGAGTGYFAFRLAAAGANVIAIDIDPRAISFMQSEQERYPEEVRERFTTRLAQTDDANLANGEVDVVLMVNTYIYIDDRVAYFRKLKDGIQPGGALVIIDFKKKATTIGPDVEDRIALTDVRRELEMAGYKISEIDDTTLDYQYVIKAVRQ